MKLSGGFQVNFIGLGSSASFQRDFTSGLFHQPQPSSIFPLYLEKNPRLHPGPHSCPPRIQPPLSSLTSAAPGSRSIPIPIPAPTATLASFCFLTTPGLFLPQGRHFLFLVPRMLTPRPSRPSGLSHPTSGRPFPFSLSLPCPVKEPQFLHSRYHYLKLSHLFTNV